ncbi:MAG TPA: nodulation protein NfeD [Thermoanaerobaculia bacterium]|nr:nodulation protein NfeD [Thermoanaerobaculia bacterium]
MKRILLLLAAVVAAATASAAPARPLVLVARLEGEIHPAAAGFVKRSIAEAEARHAALLIVEISTPGGLMTSMREITTEIVNAKVPVATFVSPSGARAASAGFFILLSGDWAAMAPETNTGAAHPVGSQGQDVPETMRKKIEQDALAQIRTLCAAHHRDPEPAEKAVMESLSYTETEALQKHLIDAIVRDPAELCRKLDGTAIVLGNGERVVMNLKSPRFETLEMGAVERALGVVSEPNFAYILFLIGIVGLYFELSHPGAVLPGVLGGVSLLLALYAFSVLPVNFTAMGLIALGILFIVSELKFPMHGMLALSGVAVFVAGSLLLFSGNRFGYRIDIGIVLPGAVLAGLVLAGLSIRAASVRSRPVRTGAEGLIGESGRALTDLAPAGRIIAHGEYWDARADTPVASGTAVRIVGKDGFTLIVRPAGGESGA